MLTLAAVTKDDVVFDLGSGDGRIPIAAAKKFGARGIGLDIDPQKIIESRANAKAAGVEQLVEFREQDVLTADISPATVVTLYLLSSANAQAAAGDHPTAAARARGSCPTRSAWARPGRPTPSIGSRRRPATRSRSICGSSTGNSGRESRIAGSSDRANRGSGRGQTTLRITSDFALGPPVSYDP